MLHGDAQSSVDQVEDSPANKVPHLTDVLVHGLNGSPSSIWKHPSSGFFGHGSYGVTFQTPAYMLLRYDADIAPRPGTNLIRIRGIAESYGCLT
jgi:hypothetical protein